LSKQVARSPRFTGGAQYGPNSSLTLCRPHDDREQEDRVSDQSTRGEALRLRAEGLSLRAVGKRLGVDEKQVRRWLKAAGEQDRPSPSRVVGTDGRTYHVGPVSAPDADPRATVSAVAHYNRLVGLYRDLQALARAASVEAAALRKAAERGEPVEAAMQAARAAGLAVLTRAGLWHPDDDRPDESLELFILSLAERLTPEGRESLLEELTPFDFSKIVRTSTTTSP
jgi:hypothetical protein